MSKVIFRINGDILEDQDGSTEFVTDPYLIEESNVLSFTANFPNTLSAVENMTIEVSNIQDLDSFIPLMEVDTDHSISLDVLSWKYIRMSYTIMGGAPTGIINIAAEIRRYI